MRANLWPLEKRAASAGPRHIVPLSSGMAAESRFIQLSFIKSLWSTTSKETHTYEMTHLPRYTYTNAYGGRSYSIPSWLFYSQLPACSSFTHACVRLKEVKKKTRTPCGECIPASAFPLGFLHFPESVRWKSHAQCHNHEDLLL